MYLSESKHPLVQHKLALLRDKNTLPIPFRELVSELASLLCYEACANLPTRPIIVETPMGSAEQQQIDLKIGIVPILRAGLGMVEAVWRHIPNAEVWHIGIYRNEDTLQPIYYYDKLQGSPRFNLALVLDPMLATGGSAVACVDRLKEWGVPHIKFISLIAAPEGIHALQTAHPDIEIYVASIDSHLNSIGYIVPGLGDAGDRQFGTLR